MSLIMKFPDILRESRKMYEDQLSQEKITDFYLTERMGNQSASWPKAGNLLVRGDNADCMLWLAKNPDVSGKLKLIYVDPPFFTRANYGAEMKLRSDKVKKIPAVRQRAYSDTWENGMEEYLKMLAFRFYLMKDLLADDGCLWVHLDWHAVHYVKVLLDEIFGEKHFINEVVWQYKSGGASKRTFARKHDTLLFYSKTDKYYFLPQKEKSYNRGLKPYRFKGVKEYRDEVGWYTMVSQKDVWQIDMVGRTSSERTGYVTQKPEALLMRILESCTREGDLCADFFGGSGTLAAAAEKMGRRWISCDSGRLATVNTYGRMAAQQAAFDLYEAADSACLQKEQEPQIHLSAVRKKDSVLSREVLEIQITGYEPGSFRELPIDEKYLSAVKEAAEADPLQFIACWSADCRYDGKTYRPQVCFCRENGNVKTSYTAFADGFEMAAVRVTDIFGRAVFLTVKPVLAKE
ncbi:MAG: site-specific DNA-methyltransferase [Anaerovoracaceae bacterium]|nr:site-specific DNA-methyltransferase [Bacillota bacterium]MDY3954064.1 site-specific DNA-methyltransferase [Anaerovoracaceae bacterium]